MEWETVGLQLEREGRRPRRQESWNPLSPQVGTPAPPLPNPHPEAGPWSSCPGWVLTSRQICRRLKQHNELSRRAQQAALVTRLASTSPSGVTASTWRSRFIFLQESLVQKAGLRPRPFPWAACRWRRGAHFNCII